ncbi:hypothetical protein ES288_D04G128100v1 [Gossypium darwinii]|uniref:Uncharacterized protein n=2 Tax=Gossypium TaxID=3633 RepID=A0A5D2LG17_GOSTO|nr:hypothetical protein ES288_D04G128100v1 [Gossypium darwinii]TYH77103.1 hypothetical protein ES332_D04G130100v1 [Gossypium tomentosum]
MVLAKLDGTYKSIFPLGFVNKHKRLCMIHYNFSTLFFLIIILIENK